MAILNIFCVIEGQMTSFSVKIPSDDTVDDLKKAIKKEKPLKFDDSAADELTLWKVAIPAGLLASLPDKRKLLDSLQNKTKLDEPRTSLSPRCFRQYRLTMNTSSSNPLRLSESDILAMGLPMIRPVRRDDRPPSSSTTRSATGQMPRVSEGSNFESDARLYVAERVRTFQQQGIAFDDRATYCSENTLTSTYDRNTTEELLLAIELKTLSTLRSDNLVRLYEQDLTLLMANFVPSSSSTHVIQQIHGYFCDINIRCLTATTRKSFNICPTKNTSLDIGTLIGFTQAARETGPAIKLEEPTKLGRHHRKGEITGH
ncbi:MAG: hypothetical protein J3Q66DRAFT_440169, partial [Benniella sp.]